jgi:hypothetical protein
LVTGWLVFPLLLAALSAGCGLALERLAGRPLPGVLLLPAGLAVVIVVAHPFTLADATAELAVPAVVVVALAGFVLTARGGGLRRPRPDPWAAAAALAVFLAYAAPALVSGEPAVAGYVKLDDSASWLALAERLGDQGHAYEGLPPSTYEAMLDFYLGGSYPLGGLLPLTIGDVLLGTDGVELYVPFIAFLAALLALCLWTVAERLVPSRPARAAVTFVAAQPALLYAYGLWGGSKEVATAWLVALAAALALPAVRERLDLRALLPLAVTGAALLAVLSLGGGVWLAALAGAAAVAAIRREGTGPALRRLAGFAGLTALLAFPSLLSAGFLGSSAVPLTETSDRTGLANLIQPLSPLQALGIWPTGEFRLEPPDMAPVYVLLAVAAAAVVLGIVAAVRARALAPLLLLGASATGAAIVLAVGTAWIDAKALAALGPPLVLLALTGAVALAATGRRVEGAVLGLAIAGGVLWSNVLGYREVQLTPAERFAELRGHGEHLAGRGPTLMTEFEPWGARLLLRDGDPEVASELRRRLVRLRTGDVLATGQSADVDEFAPRDLLVYRALVLRRSPYASRPPAVFRLARSGRSYDVWERGPGRIAGELVLRGNEARCADVVALARRGRRLAAAPLPPQPPLLPLGATRFTVPRDGAYELWVGGSFRGRLTARVDGRLVADRRHELSHGAPFVSLGTLRLRAGEHRLEVRHERGGWRPGSSGRGFLPGPVVVAPVRDPRALTTVPATRARELCGRRLDRIEALG